MLVGIPQKSAAGTTSSCAATGELCLLGICCCKVVVLAPGAVSHGAENEVGFGGSEVGFQSRASCERSDGRCALS